MSVDTQNIDHNNESDDSVYDELQKLIDSVEAEERELKIKKEKSILGRMDKMTLESNNFVDHINKSEIKMEKNLLNRMKKKTLQSNNFDDHINKSEDDSEMKVKETVIRYEDKHKENGKKRKKEPKKKKKKKESESNSKHSSRKKKSRTSHKKQSCVLRRNKRFLGSLKRLSKTTFEEKKLNKQQELDTFWKIVHDDPSNLSGWTYLLNYVDGTKNVKAAREAYDTFLNRYPCCYGFWRKYADYERKNVSKETCENVFDRGLKAIPLSVDLWIHYLEYMKTEYSNNVDMVRKQFERAVDVCGIEFRSDSLWELYIQFEMECGQYARVTNIYERLIAIPTYGYINNFECFKYYIEKYPKYKILNQDKFLELRKEVLSEINETDSKQNHGENDNLDSDFIADLYEQNLPREEHLMNKKMISSQTIIYKTTIEMANLRLPHEKKIKRPFFHLEPLGESEIRNWNEYLEFEISQGSYKRIMVLFERCLIACALYEEFWIKYVSYLESLESKDYEVKHHIENIYTRACTTHLKNKPGINLSWALYSEINGQYDKAAQILDILDSVVPHNTLIIQRRINLERRRNCYNRVCELYEHYINMANSTQMSVLFTVKYARFVWKVLNNTDRASEILWTEVKKMNDVQKSSRFLLQLIEIKMSDNPMNVFGIVELIDSILHMKLIDVEQQIIFAQRKVEFLEEFGKDILLINEATAELKSYEKMYNDQKKNALLGTDTTCNDKE